MKTVLDMVVAIKGLGLKNANTLFIMSMKLKKKR